MYLNMTTCYVFEHANVFEDPEVFAHTIIMLKSTISSHPGGTCYTLCYAQNGVKMNSFALH